MRSHQLRNNNPYRNTHENKLNKEKKEIYALADLSPVVRFIKYDVVEGRGENCLVSGCQLAGREYHWIHIQSIEKVIIDGERYRGRLRACIALKIRVNGAACHINKWFFWYCADISIDDKGNNWRGSVYADAGAIKLKGPDNKRGRVVYVEKRAKTNPVTARRK